MSETKYIYRDAETGEYVTKEYAEANPNTTIRQTVKESSDE